MFQTSSRTVLRDSRTFADEAAVQNYVCVAMMALILWEHAITLREEVSCMWQRKLSVVTVLFTVNRYGVVLYGALAIAAGLVQSRDSCTFVLRATQTMVLVLMLIFGICSALRAYVLWNRNILLFLVVLILNLIPVGANLYLYSSTMPITTHIPIAACMAYMPLTTSQQIPMIAAARVSTIVVDTIVLAVTLIKTFHPQRMAQRVNLKVPLTTTLIRDGTVYFLTVLAMNIAQLVVFQTTEQVYLISFICTLTAILISRFFLDLRGAISGGPQFDDLSYDDVHERGTPARYDLQRLVPNSPSTYSTYTPGSQETDDDIQEVVREGAEVL